nr:enoyl-CoA hydratase/isomerase family protein [Saccharopolyspora sp. HNM0983]
MLVERSGSVLHVRFHRPAQRNALTWGMYEGLLAACDRAESEQGVRVLVLSGGREAFVAGTDIAQFQEFCGGQDGVDYERHMQRVLDRVEGLPVPVVAAVSGYCVGAGLAIAACCDLRVASTTARFGVPVARTLGNCLSMNTYSLLVHHLGPGRALDMLLRARLLDAEQALAAGFVGEVCAPEELDEVAAQVAARVCEHAPLTMWASKEAVRRLRVAALPDGDDLVRAVFGSEDFRGGVRSFVDKTEYRWQGR